MLANSSPAAHNSGQQRVAPLLLLRLAGFWPKPKPKRQHEQLQLWIGLGQSSTFSQVCSFSRASSLQAWGSEKHKQQSAEVAVEVGALGPLFRATQASAKSAYYLGSNWPRNKLPVELTNLSRFVTFRALFAGKSLHKFKIITKPAEVLVLLSGGYIIARSALFFGGPSWATTIANCGRQLYCSAFCIQLTSISHLFWPG